MRVCRKKFVFSWWIDITMNLRKDHVVHPETPLLSCIGEDPVPAEAQDVGVNPDPLLYRYPGNPSGRESHDASRMW